MGVYRIFISPFLDFLLMVAIFGICVISYPKLYLDSLTVFIVIILSFADMIYNFIKGIKDSKLYDQIHNIVIIKSSNDSFILISPIVEDYDMEFLKEDNNIEKIINEKNYFGFNIYKYDNCKLLSETKQYYEYSANYNNKSTIFRIYKIYSDNNKLRVANNV